MSTTHEARAPRHAGSHRRVRGRQRGVYARRRATVLILAAMLLTGGFFGAAWAAKHWLDGGPAATGTGGAQTAGQGVGQQAGTGAKAPLPFEAERLLDVPALGPGAKVAVGPAISALRKVALVTGTGKAQRMIGQVQTLPDFPLSVADLGAAKSVLVLAGKLLAEGTATEVKVGADVALQAAGGEPDFKAWRPDPDQGLVPVDYYSLAAPTAPAGPAALVVDKGLNALWYYENGKLAATYRVATGRYLKGPKPSFANQAINYVTPLGTYTISYKAPGLPYYKKNIPAGAPENPLGTRFMGFSVFPGDKAAVWAIHGTNEPDSIGRWVSDGCIRLANADAEALYSRVKEGTPVTIVDSVNR